MKSWSYSRYGTWKKCPAILRFQEETQAERTQHPAAIRGQVVHKVVEDYILDRGKLSAELEYYRSFLDQLREQGALAELPIAVDALWGPVEWDSPDRWWRGILDCVVDYGDHAVIYDWKTGKEYPDHREQREIYAAAYFSIKPVKRIRVFHTYLDTRQNTYTIFDEGDVVGLKKKWEDRVAPMLADERLLPNPGWHCRSCQFSKDKGGPCQF